MFNKVVLVGNLTRDVELRYANNGTALGNTGIAVTRKFTQNGEKREEVCFIDLTFFARQAEIANQYLSKGSKVLIEGTLVFSQWTDNAGQKRSKHSISVVSMEMLGNNSNGEMDNKGNQEMSKPSYGNNSYAHKTTSNSYSADSESSSYSTEDHIPF